MNENAQRYVVAGIAAAVALAAGSGAIVTQHADRAVAQLATRANELRQRHEALPTHHDALWGDTADDRAFAHYGHAAELARGFEDHEIVGYHLTDELPLAELAPLRARWQPVVATACLGAHAADRRMRGAFDDPEHVADLLAFRRVVNLTVLEARCRLATGEPLEAVRHTLDAMTLGADCVHDGVLINQMIGAAMVAIGVDSWRDERLQQLDDDALAALADGLARLDQRLPTALRLERELTVMAGLLLDATDQVEWRGGAPWRYGFSGQWMTADAFLMLADGIDQLSRLDDARWPQRKVALERAVARMLESGNDAAAMITPNLASAALTLRQSKAALRLLRMAVDLHRGVERPLPDPLGDGDLTIARDGEAFVLRSVEHDRNQLLERRVELRQSTGARTSCTNR
ncbi:MAG: hypothetical protein KAI24_23315 [Planctomycetes bacterium]|nr:hypothetical protein [Planctomycetota bacterium]